MEGFSRKFADLVSYKSTKELFSSNHAFFVVVFLHDFHL